MIFAGLDMNSRGINFWTKCCRVTGMYNITHEEIKEKQEVEKRIVRTNVKPDNRIEEENIKNDKTRLILASIT